MHKDFYAGGFLFNPYSEKILLQQLTGDPQLSSPWFLFGNACFEKDNPHEIFTKKIFELLNIKIKKVFFIYSYTNEFVLKKQSIVYSEVEKLQNFPSKNGYSFAWFSFKEVLKLQTTKQMKHDIVVGQRVIEAATRKKLGEYSSPYANLP
jgi:hypothetical protein